MHRHSEDFHGTADEHHHQNVIADAARSGIKQRPIYRVFPAPGSGAERQSGDAEKTEPTGLADLWDKYHRARENDKKASS
jgi:hypothetical protein